MNIYVDQCHICLDQKYLSKKPTELCQNKECSGFICKPCWKQILQNDITNCPICRQELSTDSVIYTRIQREITRKNLFREYSKHIIFYLLFYSIGMSTISILLLYSLSLNELFSIINNLQFYYYLLSMITLPIVGFITWYASIIMMSFIISSVIKCKNLN
jgi:hypothetical protein